MCIRDRYYVKIQHDGTFDTLYAHCSSICVTPGQQVQQGEMCIRDRDNVQRVSADADADGGEGTPDPGPEDIVIDTIDRSRPVMDDILHSAADNAPAGMFGYPHFNCLLYTSRCV